MCLVSIVLKLILLLGCCEDSVDEVNIILGNWAPEREPDVKHRGNIEEAVNYLFYYEALSILKPAQ